MFHGRTRRDTNIDEMEAHAQHVRRRVIQFVVLSFPVQYLSLVFEPRDGVRSMGFVIALLYLVLAIGSLVALFGAGFAWARWTLQANANVERYFGAEAQRIPDVLRWLYVIPIVGVALPIVHTLGIWKASTTQERGDDDSDLALWAFLFVSWHLASLSDALIGPRGVTTFHVGLKLVNLGLCVSSAFFAVRVIEQLCRIQRERYTGGDTGNLYGLPTHRPTPEHRNSVTGRNIDE